MGCATTGTAARIVSPEAMAREAYRPRPDVSVWLTNTGRPTVISRSEGAGLLSEQSARASASERRAIRRDREGAARRNAETHPARLEHAPNNSNTPERMLSSAAPRQRGSRCAGVRERQAQ